LQSAGNQTATLRVGSVLKLLGSLLKAAARGNQRFDQRFRTSQSTVVAFFR
jgi:hypothetical protein